MTTKSFKGRHFQEDLILQSVRWYLAYSLSYRDIEELMGEWASIRLTRPILGLKNFHAAQET